MNNSAHKLDNLDGMLQFLPKLMQEETDNLNRPIPAKEIKSIINNGAKQKESTRPRQVH